MAALFSVCPHLCRVCPSDELDLDGQGGKMFLRVLLNMVMHNYPSLVSGALQLLFRHFSQRQEVLNAFTQVSCMSGFPIISHPSSRTINIIGQIT